MDLGAAYMLYNGAKDLFTLGAWVYNIFPTSKENIEHLKGYKLINEALDSLEILAEGNSDRKIYGQEDAKKEAIPIVEICLRNVERMKRGVEGQKKGNVIVIRGTSGNGKTEFAKSIGKAILKHPKNAKNELLKKPNGDVYYVNCQP